LSFSPFSGSSDYSPTLASWRRRVLEYLCSHFEGQQLPLRLIFWDGEHFDFAAAPTVTITLNSPDLLKMLLHGNFVRLGDAFVAGDLAVTGPTQDIIRIGTALAERIGKSSTIRQLSKLARLFSRRHTTRQDAADVSYHYDVGNDFYRLWLDEYMIYSCAYFCSGAEDIDVAQQQKLDYICRKLMLKPGERLLDIGCGWGGLLHWAAQHYGVTGVGITLSERQYAFSRRWFEADNLSDKMEIRLQDYRALNEAQSFDKIVSIGMYEHVGLQNLPLYFATVAKLLRPGGIFLNDGIVTTDPEGRAQGPPGGEFIDRYVFPGGALPHLSRAIVEVTRAGFAVVDTEDLGPHYARTLLLWTRRLEARHDEAIRAAGVERYRIWLIYLAGMAYAFDRGWLSDAQVLSFKRTENGFIDRPWTRDYQYAAHDGSPDRENLAG
jgi:cyclopropane-fatty-acyl-phospholipid synthase